MISYSFIIAFYNIFNAQIKFVCFYRAKNTFPYFPVPNYFIFSKSSIEIGRYFFLFHDLLTH